MTEEEYLHNGVASLLDTILTSETVWWHTPNGGRREKREAAKLKRMGVKAGIPDILLANEGWLFGIELKAKRGVLSEDQKALIAAFSRVDVPVAVCRTQVEVVDALKEFGIPTRGTVMA